MVELLDEGALAGWIAVRGDRVIDERAADSRFVPASVQKLLVTVAALELLGPEYRVQTEVRSTAPLQGGVVDGDLVVLAAGDPTWSRVFYPEDPREPLRELAQQLVWAGLRRVQGDLVVDRSRFPGPVQPWSRTLEEVGQAWSAPVSALAFEAGTARILIAPGPSVGEPGRARVLSRPTFELESHIVTVGVDRHKKGTVTIRPDAAHDVLVVAGEYPLSEPEYRIGVAHPSPDRGVGEAVLEVLRGAGIAVEGRVRVADERPGDLRAAPLAAVSSRPLRDWLPAILGDSDNWMAEMTGRVLARELTGSGRLDDARELVGRFLQDEVGLDPRAFQIDDLSGISPQNLVTPRAVVEVLRYSRRRPWFEQFRGALAREGEGTLRVWGDFTASSSRASESPTGPPVRPTLRAKTGTGAGIVTLAGMLSWHTPSRGAEEPVFLVCLVNHLLENRAPARRAIRDLSVGWGDRWNDARPSRVEEISPTGAMSGEGPRRPR